MLGTDLRDLLCASCDAEARFLVAYVPDPG